MNIVLDRCATLGMLMILVTLARVILVLIIVVEGECMRGNPKKDPSARRKRGVMKKLADTVYQWEGGINNEVHEKCVFRYYGYQPLPIRNNYHNVGIEI